MRHPGLDPGARFLKAHAMREGAKGGWVYIMADRYRGTIYVGVTADIVARVDHHKRGSGSDFCARYGLGRLVWMEFGEDIRACIEQQKRLKRWRRAWKFDLIERDNPLWRDISETAV